MKALLQSIGSEYYKSRKTLAFWSALLLPLLLNILVFCIFYFKAQDFLKKLTVDMKLNLWHLYLEMILGIMGSLVLPMYIIFMTFSVNNIEHRADTWKSLFALPLPKWAIYYSKVLFALLLIFVCMMLFALFSLASGSLLGVMLPKLHFQDYPIAAYLFKLYFKLFLSSIGILSIQFMLSLIWADFIKPMGLGFVVLIASIISISWEYSYALPYAHPLLVITTMKGNELQVFTKEVLVGLGVALAAFTIGYRVVSRRSVK